MRSELYPAGVEGMPSPPSSKARDRAGLLERPVRSSAGSLWPQALAQIRKQFLARNFVLTAEPILSRPAIARGERIGGGPDRTAWLTELERLAGPSAPFRRRHMPSSTWLRAFRSVPSSAGARAYLSPPRALPLSVSVFVLRTDSNFVLGPSLAASGRGRQVHKLVGRLRTVMTQQLRDVMGLPT